MRTAAPSARRRAAMVASGGTPMPPGPRTQAPRPGGRGKGKLFFGRLDGDGVAFLQPLVHEARAATAPGLVAHGDQVLVRRAGGVVRGRKVDQRVVAPVGLA